MLLLEAYAFAKHFGSCFSAADLPLTSSEIQGCDVLSCNNPITEFKAMDAIRKEKPKLPLGIDWNSSFIDNSCAEVIRPVLYAFLSYLWKRV